MTEPTTDVPPPPAAAGNGITLLAAAAFASSATLRIADPLLPQIAEEFSTTIAHASVVATTYALAYGLCQLIHGPLGDRFGKIRMITNMMVLAGLTTGLSALARDLDTLLALRLLSGAGAAAIIPLSMAHIGDTVPYQRRQEVLARYLSGVVLGILAGQAFGGILGDWLGWRGVFVALGAAYAAITALLWVKLRPTGMAGGGKPAAATGFLEGLIALVRSPAVPLVIGTVFVEGFLFYGAFTFVGAFLRQRYGLGYTAIGGLLGAFGLGALVYSMTAPTIVRRLGQRRMAMLSGVMLAIAFLALAGEPPLWLMPLPILCCGLGFYLIHNTLQTRATQMAPMARGLAVSVFASLFFLGQSAGVAAAGQAVVRIGYWPVFAVAGVCLFGLAMLFASRLRENE